MSLQETEPRWGAVVHDVDEELGDAQVLDELFHGAGQVVERVAELGRGWGLGVAESWQIGGNDVQLTSQERDQLAKHVGRRGEAVQQQYGGLARIPGLPVEHIELRELNVAVLHFVRHCPRRNQELISRVSRIVICTRAHIVFFQLLA